MKSKQRVSVYLIFLAVTVSLVFSGCEKDNGNTLPLPDDIILTDVSPDAEIRSVRIFTQVQTADSSIAYIPTPTDSTAFMDLDINGDMIKDFRITVNHSRNRTISNWHWTDDLQDFAYQVYIEGLSDENTISSDYNFCPIEYNASDTIPRIIKTPPISPFNRTNLSIWAMIFYDGLPYHFLAINTKYIYRGGVSAFKGEYIGIKMKNSYGFIHLESLPGKGVKILDYGFNRTEGNGIVCQ
jgi:hypothetical protein